MPAFPAAAASAVRGTSGSWPVLQLLFLHSHRRQCSCWSGLRQSNAPRQTRRAPSKSQLPHAPAPKYLEQLSISPRSPANKLSHLPHAEPQSVFVHPLLGRTRRSLQSDPSNREFGYCSRPRTGSYWPHLEGIKLPHRIQSKLNGLVPKPEIIKRGPLAIKQKDLHSPLVIRIVTGW